MGLTSPLVLIALLQLARGLLMKTHSEHPFPESTAEALREEIDAGSKLLGVSPDDDPAKIVAAVDAFVFDWQCGDHPPSSVLDAEDAPFRMGAVW